MQLSKRASGVPVLRAAGAGDCNDRVLGVRLHFTVRVWPGIGSPGNKQFIYLIAAALTFQLMQF
jgi:hypothetical protein